MLKVLFVASEAIPFIKTGGLADVAGSLPKALKKQGIDVRVIIPKYSKIAEEYTSQMQPVVNTTVNVSWRQQYCGVETLTYDGVQTYFVDNEQYFKRDSLYGYADDAERFGFFCRAVLDVLPQLDFMPDIIHCNDWHTGMIGAILKTEHAKNPEYAAIKTLYSIHNLKYQGIFPKEIVDDVLGVDWELFNNGSIEFDGCVNFMKAGIVYADRLSTVSETYAQEIQYEYFGENLDGLLRERSGVLSGIVNGIDDDYYNPQTDKALFANYSKNNIENKTTNKVELQKLLGLPERRDVPMIAIVSRLVEAKGLDLVAYIIDELVQNQDIQLVVLGTGDQQYEDMFRSLNWRYPDKVSANITFNETMAHRIYAASDIFMMPSKYEPCGIGQMIALRYGSIPVVRETGGLKDTVHSYDKYTQDGNGVVFANYNAHELLFSIKRALGYFQETYHWNKLVQNAMSSDCSWNSSAERYQKLYEAMRA